MESKGVGSCDTLQLSSFLYELMRNPCANLPASFPTTSSP
jgi:hypothetical protein